MKSSPRKVLVFTTVAVILILVLLRNAIYNMPKGAGSYGSRRNRPNRGSATRGTGPPFSHDVDHSTLSPHQPGLSDSSDGIDDDEYKPIQNTGRLKRFSAKEAFTKLKPLGKIPSSMQQLAKHMVVNQNKRPLHAHDPSLYSGKYPVFSRIYRIKERFASLNIPKDVEPRVRSMFAAYPGGTDNLGFVENQVIVTILNRHTHEYSMFNEVRRYRPGYAEKLSKHEEAQFEELINSTTGEKCDFCMRRVVQDKWGIIEGDHCYIASNIAKYEKWHSLVISKTHHPLVVDPDVIEDYIKTSTKWFQRVQEVDPTATFPHLMWDAGPRASASQVHAHLQLSMTADHYYSKAEHMRQAADAYAHRYPNTNYWTDVAAVHHQLGLAVSLDKCVLISNVCPIKERELIVIAPSASDPCFSKLISVALLAMRDDVGTRAFSMSIMPQEVVKKGDPPPSYPALARVVDRGAPLDRRSDVGAMEFFGANNVGADPYHIVPFLRKRAQDLQM